MSHRFTASTAVLITGAAARVRVTTNPTDRRATDAFVTRRATPTGER